MTPPFPPHDPPSRPAQPGPFDSRPPADPSVFYPPPDPAAVVEAHKHAVFARELLAHTPRTFVYHLIIAVNVLVYVAFGLKTGGWMTPDPLAMIAWGADKWEFTTAGQWWRLLTSAFLHFGAIHLAANMYALLVVGNLTERLFGNAYFAILYLLSAVISGLVSVWWDRAPDGTGAISAGASGAVFAVYGAVIAFICVRRGAFPKAAASAVLQSAVVVVGVNVAFGLSQEGISNAAHIGGLVSGLVLGAVFARPIERTARRRQAVPRLAAGVAVAVVALAAGIVALPKSTIDPRAELPFERAKYLVFAAEDRADARDRELEQRYGAAPARRAEYAAAVREHVVAPWAKAAAALEAIAMRPGTASRPLYDDLLAYARARRDMYQAKAAFIATNSQADADAYGQRAAEAAAAVARINKRPKGKRP